MPTKELQAAYMKEWRAENREKVQADFQQWKEANADKRGSYMRDYLAEYSARPERQQADWERRLHRNYRMTSEQFNELWKSQCGRCAICAVPMEPRGKSVNSVAVDHNHSTGQVRALLCTQCNRGIGCLKDSPEVLEAAARYLRSHGSYSEKTHFSE